MSKKTSLRKPIGPLRDDLPYWLIRGRLGVLHAIPYRARLLFSEWFFGQTSGPSAGYRHRINMSLGLVTPPLNRVEEKRRSRAAPNNAGRALTEIHLPKHFREIAQNTQIDCGGLAAMKLARIHENINHWLWFHRRWKTTF